MLISLLKANNNMEISWFSLYESILVLLAYSVEFTLSTWDSNIQFRLRRVVGKCSGEMKKRISLSIPWHSSCNVRETVLHLLNMYFIWLIHSILAKCAQVIHKLMFVIALPESQLFLTSEVSCCTGSNAGNYCNCTLAKENHVGPSYMVSDITPNNKKKCLK